MLVIRYVTKKLSKTWNEENVSFQAKGKYKIYKILHFLLIFIISFYFEELYSDTV